MKARTIFPVLASEDSERLDRFDVICTNFHVTLTNYPELVHRVLARGGIVRLLTIDGNAASGAIASLAGKFGQTPEELRSEIRLSRDAITRFRGSLDERVRPRFQVRFYNSADQSASPGYLIPYRSYHCYGSEGGPRLDVVVPYRSSDDGFDAPLRPALIATEESSCEVRDKAIEAFRRIWSKAEEPR